MTATEELRRLLDERGAEYRVSATGYSIDIGPYTTAYANRSDTTLDVSLRQVTPEQAVAATLGRGECKNTGECRWFCCSECGFGFSDIFINYERRFDAEHQPNFCPNCGRRVSE